VTTSESLVLYVFCQFFFLTNVQLFKLEPTLEVHSQLQYQHKSVRVGAVPQNNYPAIIEPNPDKCGSTGGVLWYLVFVAYPTLPEPTRMVVSITTAGAKSCCVPPLVLDSWCIQHTVGAP
jgi:hypothetical protein